MKKILIVDDDTISLDLLALSLSRYPGYEILKAKDGLEAIDLCRHSPPNLVILDVEMPGLSGIDVASALNSGVNIPFIFLSSHGEDDIVQLAAVSGALGYIVKPVKVDQLIPAIEVALKRANELKKLQGDRANLTHALGIYQDIATAVGIIMVLRGTSRGQAIEALGRAVHNSGVKQIELARRIINGEAIENLSPGFAQNI